MRLISKANYEKCVAVVASKVGQKAQFGHLLFTVSEATFRPTLTGHTSGNIGLHVVDLTKKNGERLTVSFAQFLSMFN